MLRMTLHTLMCLLGLIDLFIVLPGDSRVMQSRLGVLAVEFKIERVSGVALIRGPYRFAGGLFAPDHRDPRCQLITAKNGGSGFLMAVFSEGCTCNADILRKEVFDAFRCKPLIDVLSHALLSDRPLCRPVGALGQPEPAW